MNEKLSNLLSRLTNSSKTSSVHPHYRFVILLLGFLSTSLVAKTFQDNIDKEEFNHQSSLQQSKNLIKNPSFEQGDNGDHWKAINRSFERHHSSILKVEFVDGKHQLKMRIKYIEVRKLGNKGKYK